MAISICFWAELFSYYFLLFYYYFEIIFVVFRNYFVVFRKYIFSILKLFFYLQIIFLLVVDIPAQLTPSCTLISWKAEKTTCIFLVLMIAMMITAENKTHHHFVFTGSVQKPTKSRLGILNL